jgi:mannose-1-phosphate guanylyltransferase/MurNAc alpha-1-phosphate uridylyltransferase
MLTLPVLPGDTGGFSGRRFAGFSLLPWRYVRDLPAEQGSLVHAVWRPAEARGELELVGYGGVYIDSGTPADYLRANLHAAGGQNMVDASATVTGHAESCVIGAHAEVAGRATRCVIWPHAKVTASESLTNAIRAPQGLTVRPGSPR